MNRGAAGLDKRQSRFGQTPWDVARFTTMMIAKSPYREKRT
jgi:hypothetical protein